jgi:hypothetical protein
MKENGPSPRGCLKIHPRVSYLFSAGHAPERAWTFPIRGPKWPRKHSPGFTLDNSPTRISPERATGCGENRLRTFEPDRLRISNPFRAKRLFRLTQGKPWANLSRPFGAGPSGRLTGAKTHAKPWAEFSSPFGAKTVPTVPCLSAILG